MVTLDLDKIPPELKAFPNWVCWRQNKIPVNPKTGDNAKADDPNTWSEFDQAVRHWKAHRVNGIGGIGFEFSQGDPYTGMDLDKCRNPDTGEIEPWALEIVRRLNSYTEISPSGTGLHIFIKAELPPGARRKGKVEMYSQARYFTVTGNHLEGTPSTIENRQTEMTGLHALIFGNAKTSLKDAGHRSGPELELSDQELIDFACRKDGKFARLWRGDTGGYATPSEADYALVHKLAFWTNKDPEGIDRLFRMSGLCQDSDRKKKWQRLASQTINKAIVNTPEGYNPGKEKRKKRKKSTTTKPDTQGGPHQDQTEIATHIARLNQHHAVAMLGGKCAILNIGEDITFSSVADFNNFQANNRIRYGGKSQPVAKLWLESPNRRQYPGGVVFSPGKDTPGCYNLWRGFAVAPVPGDWSLYQEHMLKIICDGNERHFKYLLDWMARNVQDPGGERPGVAVVLKSNEFGTGKGVFAREYGGIFGNHFLHITQGAQLVGRFNAHMKNCSLLFCDEGLWGGNIQAAGVLKGLITEPTMLIEPKGVNPFRVDNHMSFIIASNNDWIVPAGLDERRFFCLDVSPARKQDTEYFRAILKQMSQGGKAALLYDLLKHKITVDLRQAPRTPALFDQVVNGMTTVQKFWFERLRRGDETLWGDFTKPSGWNNAVLCEHLYGDYTSFATICGERFKLTDAQFGKELRRLCPLLKRGRKRTLKSRSWFYFAPPLHVCRTKFEEAVGMEIDWRSEHDEVEEDEDE